MTSRELKIKAEEVYIKAKKAYKAHNMAEFNRLNKEYGYYMMKAHAQSSSSHL